MNSPAHLLEQARDKLDEHGTKAWIATMILGFIFLWPVGLVILFYMIGTNRMGKNCKRGQWHRRGRHSFSTGNTAFDAYRDETIKRLEDEQNAFQNFLGNLRASKDRVEFDQFMREQNAKDVTPEPTTEQPSGYPGNPTQAPA
ncbi:hypothetical protein A9Q96_02955 [Rhodobacterales bacterium 52_120_T64]|nr:hypothetical protein A9Q96_02955 [Rhodobacterales bacterium 52_120_T64]